LVGNPDLSPSFTNSFESVYRLNNRLTRRTMALTARYFFTNDALTTDRNTDVVTGKATYRYTNISAKSPYRYSLRGHQGGILGIADIGWTVDLNATGEATYNYINGEINKAS